MLDRGFNYRNPRALSGHAIDHVDIGYIHAYYVSPAEEMRFFLHGIPDPDAPKN